MSTNKYQVIIVGGGFAGFSCYVALKKAGVKKILIIDERSSFEYTPALHDVITAPNRDTAITLDFKHTLKDNFIQSKVTQISKNQVSTDKTTYTADFIVLSSGSETNYFGNESFKKYGLAFKSLDDIKKIREKLPQATSVAVIGGGYTGVEIASVFATETDKKIHLIHSRDRVLDMLSTDVSIYCQNYLERNGVTLHLEDRGVEFTPTEVVLKSGTKVPADIIILSSGIQPRLECLKTQEVELSPQLCVVKDDSIFMCGDVAKTHLLPTAHNAMIEGRYVADQILVDMGIKKSVPPLPNKGANLLAIALGRKDGVLTYGQKMMPFPFFTGLAKWVIEKRVLFEFKYHIQLPL